MDQVLFGPSTFCLKRIILPRQARDKRTGGEDLNKDSCSLLPGLLGQRDAARHRRGACAQPAQDTREGGAHVGLSQCG